MAPHSSTLAWKIQWMEETGKLQSLGSRRVGHDWATSLSLFTFMHWRRNGNPLQCSCLENPRGGGAWWAATYGVAQSRTQLMRLSSSSSSKKEAGTEWGTLEAFQFSSVQLLSRVWLFVTPWIATHQASLSITNSKPLAPHKSLMLL